MNQLDLYPEIHRRLWSSVDNAAAMFDGGELDERRLDQMTQHVINNSGILRNPPRGHSRQSINDFVRFLLLCRLWGVCPPMRPPVRPPVRPPFFPPFFPINAQPVSNTPAMPAHGTPETTMPPIYPPNSSPDALG